jgi:hypothetical protein
MSSDQKFHSLPHQSSDEHLIKMTGEVPLCRDIDKVLGMFTVEKTRSRVALRRKQRSDRGNNQPKHRKSSLKSFQVKSYKISYSTGTVREILETINELFQ